jgi:hypothetical protein
VTSVGELVLELFLDDSVAARSNRQAILDTHSLSVIGIGVGPHPKFHNVCVICYTGGMRPKQQYNIPLIPSGGLAEQGAGPDDIPPQIRDSGYSYVSFSKRVFDEVNWVRTNPQDCVSFLERNLGLFRDNLLCLENGNFLTQEGPIAVLECIEVMRN